MHDPGSTPPPLDNSIVPLLRSLSLTLDKLVRQKHVCVFAPGTR